MIELIENLRETADRAPQTVDSVNEQQVVAMHSGFGEGLLQPGPLYSASAHLIAEAPHQLPPVLDLDVGSEAHGLGFERVGLMFLVGGNSGVCGDSQLLTTPFPRRRPWSWCHPQYPATTTARTEDSLPSSRLD